MSDNITISAQEARMLISRQALDDLQPIFEDIRKEANEGNNRSFWYKGLNLNVIQALEEKGFKVESQPSIAIQKDSLHYIITW